MISLAISREAWPAASGGLASGAGESASRTSALANEHSYKHTIKTINYRTLTLDIIALKQAACVV